MHDFESNQCIDWPIEAEKDSLGPSIAHNGEYHLNIIHLGTSSHHFLICQQREVGFHCSGVWKSRGKSFTTDIGKRLYG